MTIESKFSPGDKVWVVRDAGSRDMGPCKSCDGKGKLPDIKGRRILCSACSGTGKIIRHGNWHVVDKFSDTVSMIELRVDARDTYEFICVRAQLGNMPARLHSSCVFSTKKEAQSRCRELNKDR